MVRVRGITDMEASWVLELSAEGTALKPYLKLGSVFCAGFGMRCALVATNIAQVA